MWPRDDRCVAGMGKTIRNSRSPGGDDQILKREQVSQRRYGKNARVAVEWVGRLEHSIVTLEGGDRQAGAFEQLGHVSLGEESKMSSVVDAAVSVGPAFSEKETCERGVVANVGQARKRGRTDERSFLASWMSPLSNRVYYC